MPSFLPVLLDRNLHLWRMDSQFQNIKIHHIFCHFFSFSSHSPPPPKKKNNNTNTQNCQKLVLFFLFRTNKMSKNLRGAGPKPSGAQGAVPRNRPPPSRAQDSCSRRPPPLRGPAPDGRPAMGKPEGKAKGGSYRGPDLG